jgi:hypothetical protein
VVAVSLDDPVTDDILEANQNGHAEILLTNLFQN